MQHVQFVPEVGLSQHITSRWVEMPVTYDYTQGLVNYCFNSCVVFVSGFVASAA